MIFLGELYIGQTDFPRQPRNATGALFHGYLTRRRSFQHLVRTIGRKLGIIPDNDCHREYMCLFYDAIMVVYVREAYIRKRSTGSSLCSDILLYCGINSTLGNWVSDSAIFEKHCCNLDKMVEIYHDIRFSFYYSFCYNNEFVFV